MAAGKTTEALILRLALQGLPLPEGADADEAFTLVSPILARNRELSRRLAGTPARAFALDPGLVNTDMGEKAGDWLSSLVWNRRKRGGAAPEVPVSAGTFCSGSSPVATSGTTKTACTSLSCPCARSLPSWSPPP